METAINDVLTALVQLAGVALVTGLFALHGKLKNYITNKRTKAFFEKNVVQGEFLYKIVMDFVLAAEQKAESKYDDLTKGEKMDDVIKGVDNYLDKTVKSRGVDLDVPEDYIRVLIERAVQEINSKNG